MTVARWPLRVVLFFAVGSLASPLLPGADGNRLTYLDEHDPYYVSRDFPRLITPQWVGEEGVDAVVILAIDDMRSTEPYERYLGPILTRLKEIDGRAPVSIMTNRLEPDAPILQKWLTEGLSLECHTLDHPCPLLRGGDFAKAKATYDGCVDLLSSVPGNEPVAFRMPCMDSRNTPSPRFYAEIFNRTTPGGRFLRIDSSVCNVTTLDDPELPRELVVDADGRPRFRKYIPFPSFVNTVENYPYPYVLGKLCWQFPCVVPSDWEAQNLHGVNHAVTVRDLQAQIDVTVIKQGTFTLVFHPHGWLRNDQVVQVVDHAVRRHGKRILFLNFREAAERLREHLLAGHPLRRADGGDNGVRLLDVDADGYLDVVVGNDEERLTRLWDPRRRTWKNLPFPCPLVAVNEEGERRETGVQFGVIRGDGQASAVVRNEDLVGAWHFDGRGWREDPEFFAGLELDGEPVLTRRAGRDQGVRLRDLDGDGRSEVVVGSPSRTAVFRRASETGRWTRLPFALPDGATIVDEEGRDAGLRFRDIDGDLRDDVVFSNTSRYSLSLFQSMDEGWSRKVLAGARDEGKDSDRAVDLPPITRNGTENGAWFHSRHLWVQNEDTAGLADLVDRRSYRDLLRDIPPGARSPQAGLASLEVREGFTVELMASEPLVRDPVAFDWDGEGRLWVAEMIDYPLGLDGEKKPGGRIVVLSDEDGDQRYDRSTVFLDELPFPTGVRPWRRGALVTTIPRIIYAEDRDGDGRADVTKTLFEGFGHGNEQHLLNGFAWGLDNWLHCANGDSGGVVGGLNLSGRDFRIRPDEGRIELVSGGTQFGRCRDDWGNWFGCSNPRPMFHFVLGDRYLRRNAFLAAPRPQRNVVPAAGPVHPSSRTLPRFNDLHMANRFTSACGLTIYRDELFGADFAGNAFVSEPAHNLVHRIVLEARGVTFDGRRAAGEEKSEFLSSTDNWFRPTSLRVGPDGALWLADMYREVIEHPQYFFTGNFKAFDVRAGSERGRIYRVFPRRRKPRRIPKLAGRGSEALVDSLASPGGWERDFAQQLLVGRRDGTAVPRLERLAIHGEKAVGRLHALCTLDGLGKLSVPLLEKALEDRHGGVRRHAVRLAEGFLEDSEALGNALLARLDDPDPHVELQLACTLGEWTSERAGHALGALAWKRRDDPYVRAAALSSALPHLESVVDVVLGKLQAAGPEGSTELAETLLPMAVAGAGDRPALVERIVGALASAPGERYAAWQLRTLQGALDSLASGKDRTALDALRKRHGPELDRVLRRAREVLESVEEDEALRVAAARLLGRSALVRGRGERAVVAEDLRALGEVLSARHSTTLQRAAVEAIGRMRLPEAADGLLAAWSASSPELKGRILDALLGRDEWLPRVIDALSRGTIRPGEIDASRRRRLTEHEDLGKRAREVLRATTSPDRRQVLERFRDVASLTGSPERGLAHFEAKCSPCHRLAGRGFAVASDLAALTDKSTAALLVAIIDPSRNVESKYLQYSAVTRDGRVLSGILREEAGASVTLLAQEGKEHVLLRRDIVRFESSGTSLMPEGLEEGLTPQGMADLIAAISEAYPPLKKFAGNEPRVVRPYPDGRLELTAENCEIYGASVIFEAKYRNLGYWQSVDDQAVWRIDLPRGGEYDVTLQFACADSEAGGEFLVHSAGGQLTGRVRGTGDWDTYRRRQIGTLSLGAGPEKLVFRSRGAFNGFLIDLRGLILKPKGDANR